MFRKVFVFGLDSAGSAFGFRRPSMLLSCTVHSRMSPFFSRSLNSLYGIVRYANFTIVPCQNQSSRNITGKYHNGRFHFGGVVLKSLFGASRVFTCVLCYPQPNTACRRGRPFHCCSRHAP